MAGAGERARKANRWPRGWRDWRLMTWVVVSFNVLWLARLIVGVASSVQNCAGFTANRFGECQAVNEGVRLHAMVSIALWVVTDAILASLWLVTRPRRRSCPACGYGLGKGVTHCPMCL